MKKLGILVIVVLLVLVAWHSGVFDDERVIGALETGIRGALSLLERGLGFIVEKLTNR